MNDTDTITVNTPRLFDLARWLTQEERTRRLGGPSHWAQNVWVDTDGEAEPLRVVETDGALVIKGWSCGTAACAAGHISLEDGGMPAFYYDSEPHPTPPPPGHDVTDYNGGDVLDAALATLSSSFMYFPGRAQAEEIENYAQEALGLDRSDASRLFNGDNDWPTMMRLIAEFTGTSEDHLVVMSGGGNLPPDPDDVEYDDDEDDESDCDCAFCR